MKLDVRSVRNILYIVKLEIKQGRNLGWSK